jgi:VWFA-related protein
VIQSPHTQLVPIETSVLDKHGDFVGGLAQNQFRVLDNGVEQPISFFAPVEAPVQVLVMLETSPAVYLIRDQHLVAAYALAQGLGADDQVALVTYDVMPKTILSFTSDKSALLDALGKTQYNLGMGDLSLYDSISTVMDWLAPVTGKRAIVLLTTGLDSSPTVRWEALSKKLEGQDVVIFSVALGGPLRGPSTKKSKPKKGVRSSKRAEVGGADEAGTNSDDAFAKADEALRSLAKTTGGQVYFPQSDADFAPIYREIASALRHQYVLGISPGHDNQFHKLTVEVDSSYNQRDAASSQRGECRVFARAGYLAPGP